MRGWWLVAVVVLLAGACTAKAKPQVQPETTPLQVPAAPPRVIVPPEPEPVPLEPLPEPERTTSRPTHRSVPSQKPAPRPEAAPPIAPETPASAAPSGPPAESLEPVLPTSAGDVERRVRQELQRASADLGRVDYGALSADGKGQYDMAKRFIEQADEALRDRNLVFARKLAEKAAGIASVLLGR